MNFHDTRGFDTIVSLETIEHVLTPHGFITYLKQIQPFNPLTVLARKEKRLSNLRTNLGHYYLTHPKALLQRCWATLRHGLANHYLTSVWRKPRA